MGGSSRADRRTVLVAVAMGAAAAMSWLPVPVGASGVSAAGDAGCAGPTAWAATWIVSVAAPPGAMWRLDGSTEPMVDGAQSVVVDRIVPLAELSTQLELIAVVELPDGPIEILRGGVASIDRPESCTSAPAPPAAPPEPAPDPTPVPVVGDPAPPSPPVPTPVTPDTTASSLRTTQTRPAADPGRAAGTTSASDAPVVASLAPVLLSDDRSALPHSVFVEASRSIVELARSWFGRSAPIGAPPAQP